MFSHQEYLDWCRRHGYRDRTRKLIDEIRSSEPTRRVKSGGGSVAGRYPSRKMGVTVQFESRTVEGGAIYLMEHDPSVFEYYDQPRPLHLHYRSAAGRAVGPVHTPDFFVLDADGAGWDEWKTESKLIALAERAPERYVRTDGGWRCPPGEVAAAAYGLRYRLRSEAEINPVVVRNLRFLGDFMTDDTESDPAIAERLVQLVTWRPGISVRDLIDIATDLVAAGQGAETAR